MHILIISDAWQPQVNGVVRTLTMTKAMAEQRGHRVSMLTPDLFRSMPCPTYPEIRLAFTMPGRIGAMIDALAPDAIHIATEGPLGIAARRWSMARGAAFTTAYHTHFPDYVAARTPLSAAQVWRYIRWFHGPAARILTVSESLRTTLRAQGLTRLAHWGRGVDHGQFHPDQAPCPAFANLPRPIMLSVGRVAVEKNLDAFLSLPLPGTKVVVGDGPALPRLRHAYPYARFTGPLSGAALASAYAGADVFVFPSHTDTFGLVMIEAMACGTPVAAFPVPGPADIISPSSGVTDDDLSAAIARALMLDRAKVAQAGAQHSWAAATDQFLDALVPMAATNPMAPPSFPHAAPMRRAA